MENIETKRCNSWDGKFRTLYKKLCLSCNNYFWLPKNRWERAKTCSQKCYGLLQQKTDGQEVSCHQCLKKFHRANNKIKMSKSGLQFCSRECKDIAQRWESGVKEIWPNHYDTEGKSSYRQRALRHLKSICVKCDYSDDVRMLDVDHIDSNRSNNNLENLQVLCVWCHALKTRGVVEQ